MLLRQISRHLSEQNWVAVVLDFLIVVAGIFVGLQVDDWNTERKERIEERIYLDRLHADVRDTITKNQDFYEFVTGHAERAGLVLRSLANCRVEAADRDAFATGLYQLGKLFRPYMANGTLDELRSTGRLDLLRDPDLRVAIQAATSVHAEFDRTWDQLVQRILPPVVYVDSRVAFRIEAAQRGNEVVHWADLDFDLEGVCRDQRFRKAIATVRNYAYDNAAWLRATREAFADLEARLVEQIGDRGV